MLAKIKAYLYAAGSALVALIGVILYSKGRKSAKDDARLDDYENAEDIRRRVSSDRADKLRKLDGAGWRD